MTISKKVSAPEDPSNGSSGKTSTSKAKIKEVKQKVDIPRLQIAVMTLTLIGDSPLICHNWSNKSKTMMLDKMMHKATEARPARDPQQDFKDSLYPHPEGGYGFPVIGFKAAAVDAASFVDGITKVMLRGAFHINGELVKIQGIPTPREDMVRVGMGAADIRYRGEFKEWKAKLSIRFNSRVVSAEQITNMFMNAGFAVGVGEWRPQKDGNHGMFHVE
jgi:hypothetical protein